MTRIVNGKVVTEEEYWKSWTSGPMGFIVAIFRQVYFLIKLFLNSIFNPQSLTNMYRRDNRGPGGEGAGPRRPTIINRIKPSENCRAGS